MTLLTDMLIIYYHTLQMGGPKLEKKTFNVIITLAYATYIAAPPFSVTYNAKLETF